MKRFISIAILMAILFAFFSVSFATPLPDASPTPTNEVQNDDTPWYRVDVKIEKLYEAIKTIVSSIQDFFEDGVTGVVEKTSGIILEAGLNISSFDGKWVFSTPKLIEFSWVRSLWWYAFAFSLIFLCIGIGISVIKIFTGKKSFNSMGLLKGFLIAAVGCMFSLYASDKLIDVSNLFINSVANEVLVAEYNNPQNQSAILIKGLPDNEIGFDSFDGKSLVKMVFGSPLNDNEPLYETFMTKNGGGGLLVMYWAMFCFIIMGLFSTLRYGAIGLMGALSSIYISKCAWTGDETPAVGYINLFIRSIILSYIFDAAWLVSYFVIHNPWDFQGIGPQILACVMFTIAIIVSVFTWLLWFVKAATMPATLAGGAAMQWVNNKSQKVGSFADKITSRFGMKTDQRSGSRSYTSSSAGQVKNNDSGSSGKNVDSPAKQNQVPDMLKDAEQKSSKFQKPSTNGKEEQQPKQSYFKDKSGSYIYIDDALGKAVKCSKPPKNGVPIEVIKNESSERGAQEC